MTSIIELKLTLYEAHAILRAPATAGASDETEDRDKQPISWVATRLLELLDDRITEQLG